MSKENTFVKNLNTLQEIVLGRVSSHATSIRGQANHIIEVVNLLLDERKTLLKGDDKLYSEFKKELKIKFCSPEYINVFSDLENGSISKCVLAIDACSGFLTETFLEGSDYKITYRLDFFSVYIGFNGWHDFVKKKESQKSRESEQEKSGEIIDDSTVKKIDEIKTDTKGIIGITKAIQENKPITIEKYITNNTPQIQEDKIVGREKDLENLHSRLFGKESVVLVNAMGGIGKTTFAAVYATKYMSEYSHIAWINQNSNGSFKNDIVYTSDLQKRLNIFDKNIGKDIDEIYSNIIRNLDSFENEPCLLVIDNADEKLSHFRYSLPKNPKWHILVTSREKIPLFDEVLNLDFLSLEDAIKLYKRNYGREYLDDTVIEGIVKDLDYHTLAIEILAKTARKRDQMPESILEFLKENKRADLKVRHNREKEDDKQKIERITDYLCKIFSNISDLTDENKWLLQQFSCLPSNFHNYNDTLKELIKNEKNNEFDLRENLEILSDKGWLQYDTNSDSYKLHRIIIEVIKKEIPIKLETVKPLFSYILSKISLIYNSKDDPKFKNENYIEKFRKWIPFGKVILSQFSTSTDNLVSRLQNSLALVLHSLGGKENLVQAKILLEKAIYSAEKNLDKLDPQRGINYSNLAIVLADLGGIKNLLQAKELLEKAIYSAEKKFDDLAPQTASRNSNLSMVLKSLGGKENLVQAKILLEKVIVFYEKNHGKLSPQTAVRYSNLAIVLQDLGGKENLIQARIFLEKTIDSDEKNFGKEALQTADHYCNLALVIKGLKGEENLVQAKTLLKKAIYTYEKKIGEQAPKLGQIYSYLALVLLDLGGEENLLEAKKKLEKAIDLTDKNFGKKSPQMALIYSNLALVLKALGGNENLLKAKTLLKKAIEMAEKSFGEKAFITARRYYSMALLLHAIGGEENVLQAIILLEKAVKIYEKTLGVNHPDSKALRRYLNILKNY